MNLGELENMAKYDQEVKLLFNRINISSYDDFVSCVNVDLDHCVVMLQDKAKYLQPGKNGEDQVSATLALILEGMLYSVSSCFMKGGNTDLRSEEHTSELQSRPHLVCRLLLEKKKKRGGAESYGA